MMQKAHGMFEDVAAEIGYTAATLLVDWFGGIGQLYVPIEATQEHPIAKVIGMPAMQRLVKMFEGSTPAERFVWLNQNEQRDIARRDRLIAALIYLGLGAKQIGVLTGMSERHVFAARLRVEQLGILPMILKRSGVEGMRVIAVESCEEDPGGDFEAKVAGKTQGVKPGVKAGGKTQGEQPGLRGTGKKKAQVKRRSKRAW